MWGLLLRGSVEAERKERGEAGQDWPHQISVGAAVRRALSEVTGAYAVCVVSDWEPGTIYAAKTASPLIIGYGDGENWLASDIPAIMRHTRNVVVMEDGDFAVITKDRVELSTVTGKCAERAPFAGASCSRSQAIASMTPDSAASEPMLLFSVRTVAVASTGSNLTKARESISITIMKKRVRRRMLPRRLRVVLLG